MKYLLPFILLVSLLGCSNNKEKVNLDSLVGDYVSYDYIKSLRKTKSTKASQDVAQISTANIRKENGKYRITNTWNFHEGGGDDYVILKDDSILVVGENGGNAFWSLKVESDSVLIVCEGRDSFSLLKMNTLLPENEILLGNKGVSNGIISLLPSGEVVGLDSIKRFSIAQDYYDMAMDVDLIYFESAEGERTISDYSFKVNGEYFEIYTVKCLHEEEADCTEIDRDSLLWRLKRVD